MDKETRLKVLRFLVDYFMTNGEDHPGSSPLIARQMGMSNEDIVLALKILEREGTLTLHYAGKDEAGPTQLTPFGLTYFER